MSNNCQAFVYRVFFALGLLWICLGATYQAKPLPSPDLWWLLADGRLIAQSHSIPQVDPFSWTASGAPWHNDQWLSALLAYLAWSAWGLGGLHLCKSLLLSFTLLILLESAWRQKATALGLLVGLGLALSFSQAGFFFDVRAYLFSYLLLACLWRWLQMPRPLHLGKIAGLFTLWANLHGGVSAGLLLLLLQGLWAPRAEKAHLGRALAIATVCSCLNPSGIWLLLHPLKLLGSPWGKHLNEWQPLWRQPQHFYGHLLHLVLLALAGRWRPSRWAVPDKVLLSFGLFALSGWRHITLFALLSLPRWARLIQGSNRWAWPVGGLMLLLAGIRPLRIADPAQSGESLFFPQQACEFLAQQAPPRPVHLFHPYGLGGYLLWRFPQGPYRVCIDGRAVQVYPWSCYEAWAKAVYNPAQFERYCQRYRIEMAVLFSNPGQLESVRLLQGNESRWQLLYRDHLVAIVRRVEVEGPMVPARVMK